MRSHSLCIPTHLANCAKDLYLHARWRCECAHLRPRLMKISASFVVVVVREYTRCREKRYRSYRQPYDRHTWLVQLRALHSSFSIEVNGPNRALLREPYLQRRKNPMRLFGPISRTFQVAFLALLARPNSRRTIFSIW